VAVAASANAEMLDPGDKELGKRVSFIFDDGQRNLATACATRIFYLWRRPAQVGDSRAYLWRRPAQLGDGPRTAAYLLSLATASASWRRPAQFVYSR